MKLLLLPVLLIRLFLSLAFFFPGVAIMILGSWLCSLAMWVRPGGVGDEEDVEEEEEEEDEGERQEGPVFTDLPREWGWSAMARRSRRG